MKEIVNQYFERCVAMLLNENFADLIALLRLRKFAAKDLGISYRELNYWSTQDLLFETNEFGKKRCFSLVEFVWIEVVKELRLYNVPLKTIKSLKDNLNEHMDFSEYVNESAEALELTRAFLEANFNLEKKVLDEIVTFSTVVNMLENFRLNLFELLLFDVYLLKFNHVLVINDVGDFVVHGDHTSNLMDFRDNWFAYIGASYLTISIPSILSRIFENFKVEELNKKWMLISQKEEKVLNFLKSSLQLKSLTVRFNEKSEIDLVEYTQELQISPYDYLKKLMISGGYEKIEIRTQKGGVVFCEKATKVKL